MLRKHKKLTKKELKKDPLVIFIAQATEYLRDEWLKIVGTIVTVLLIISIAFLIVNGRRKSTLNAYDAAMTALANDAPEALDLLKRLVDNHGGTDEAADALIKLGNEYLRQNDLDSAEKYYQQYIKKYSDDQIYSLNAYNGLGTVYEEKGEYQKAGDTYEEFIDHYSHSVFLPMMYLNAGKAYFHAGEKEAAKRNFLAIKENFEDSKEMQEATFFLELIN